MTEPDDFELPGSVRHFHGDLLHDHPGGGAAHDHPRGRRPRKGLSVLAVVVIVVAVLAGWHIVGNEMSKSNPPAACQLFGGQWSIWAGWSCG